MGEKNQGKSLMKYVPDYVVFDLETTGLSPARDEMIEISGLKVNGGTIVDTFSTLINPGRKIPAQATRVNGITDEMIADAPVLKEALTDFLAFSGSYVLVGHNIRSFDLKFINCAAERLFGKTIKNDYIDTLHMSRRCLPQLSSHKLVNVSAYFSFSCEGAHRALNDCIMNQKCYEAMGKLQQTVKAELCPQCSSELVRRNGKFGAFWGCANFPECRYTRNI